MPLLQELSRLCAGEGFRPAGAPTIGRRSVIGSRPALCITAKIVGVDFVAPIAPQRSVVLEIADQLAAFRVGTDHRIARLEKLALFSLDVAELAVAVGMRWARQTLDVRPQRIAKLLQQPSYRRVRNGFYFPRQGSPVASAINSVNCCSMWGLFFRRAGARLPPDGHGRSDSLSNRCRVRRARVELSCDPVP